MPQDSVPFLGGERSKKTGQALANHVDIALSMHDRLLLAHGYMLGIIGIPLCCHCFLIRALYIYV